MSVLTALITGANRGLGLETARQLLEKDVQVVLTCRDAVKGQTAVQQLREVSPHISFLPLDISRPEQISAVADQIEQQYGHLDILINNAAITHAGTAPLPAVRMSNTIMQTNIEDIKAVFDVNVWGTLQLTQALLPLLQKSTAGRIINLSSELGSIQLQADATSPVYHVKKFAYNSSKTMVNLLTVYLQEALRDTNVRAYTISPGWVKTDMGTAAAFLEIPEGAKIIVQAALEDVPTNRFFTHQWQEIPW
ncbi:SDR family NAD(P)-dependent oxidoreductase [Chitinophaga sp. G-6-1-13]|uniref:SDR family NAD(P)-dependent oxidoreductase n=1 Tax=Chitinophaga fulva TaxID=2728842 RepID=A0A848GM89_9BACT|nr:SDR family NAD(P)-dependent oxidoreductase [Chitinophaga fulva]NML37800.1 SDR family NAD(P)-dependent oxidoreductase [Chitinophaga fulva]